VSNGCITDKLVLFETKGEKRNRRKTKNTKKATDLEGLHKERGKNMGRSRQEFVGRQRGFVA
jgi:hypothetical protein